MSHFEHFGGLQMYVLRMNMVWMTRAMQGRLYRLYSPMYLSEPISLVYGLPVLEVKLDAAT